MKSSAMEKFSPVAPYLTRLHSRFILETYHVVGVHEYTVSDCVLSAGTLDDVNAKVKVTHP